MPKSKRILSDKDFLKHGFKFYKEFTTCRYYTKSVGRFDFEIQYHKTDREVIAIRVNVWQNEERKKLSINCLAMETMLILKNTDLSFLLKRCSMYASAL